MTHVTLKIEYLGSRQNINNSWRESSESAQENTTQKMKKINSLMYYTSQISTTMKASQAAAAIAAATQTILKFPTSKVKAKASQVINFHQTGID